MPPARSRLSRALVLLSACLALPAGAETRAAGSVLIDSPVRDDLYIVAGDVEIDSLVSGSAAIAAASVDIAGDVNGDATLAAGRIGMDGGVGGDLRAAGGDVTIGGFVTDKASIAGDSVTIRPASAIGGRTWIAGRTVDIEGQLGADLVVRAGTVVISGRIAGNVDVTAREIRIAPGAVIGGDLVWHSNRVPFIDENAQVFGEVISPEETRPQELPNYGPGDYVAGWSTGIAVGVAALMLLWFAPDLAFRSASLFRAAPWSTLLLGAAALCLGPLVVLLLFVTVLGWVLGLLLVAGYIFGLMLSGLLGLLIMVQLARSRFDRATAAAANPAPAGWRSVLLLGLLVAAVIAAQAIPLLGEMIVLLLVLAGFGALTGLATGRGKRAADGSRPAER